VVILVDTDVADIIHYIFLVFPTYGYVSHVCIEVHWIHMKEHLSYFLTQLDLITHNSRWASLVMVTNNQLAGISFLNNYSVLTGIVRFCHIPLTLYMYNTTADQRPRHKALQSSFKLYYIHVAQLGFST